MESVFSGKKGKVSTACLAVGLTSGHQMNTDSDTLLVVIEGQALVRAENSVSKHEHNKKGDWQMMKKDDAMFIPKNIKYEIKNDGKTPLIYSCIIGVKEEEFAM